MSAIIAFAKRQYQQRPFVSNVATMATLYGAGDCIQQGLSHYQTKSGSKYKHDWHRTRKMCEVGLFMGPLNHTWYTWIDRTFPSARTLGNVTRKVLADQGLFAPVATVAFYSFHGLVAGSQPSAVAQEVQSKFLPTYIADLMLWPPAQFVNFFLVPAYLRVVYVSVVTLGWNCYLSHMKHKPL